jgi:predicted permease
MGVSIMAFELRTGFRLLHRAPGFAVPAIITLAVGIGATTAMFSVIDRVLVHTLPYPRSESLVAIWNRAPSLGYQQLFLSPGDYVDYRTKNHAFEEMGASRQSSAAFKGDGEPRQVSIAHVTASLFRVLQISPTVGRTFTPEEDAPGRQSVAVVSRRFARQVFHSEANALGHLVKIDSTEYEVIGVLPDIFQFPERECDVWLPLAFGMNEPHLGHNYTAIARLKSGVSMRQAQSDLEVIASSLTQQFPDTNAGILASVGSLQESLVGDVRPALFVLLGAVAFVLILACANVANLLLARALARQGDNAVRLALGANRRDVVLYFALQSLPLAILGGVLGLVFAAMCLTVLRNMVPASVPGNHDFRINGEALIFTTLLSFLTCLFFSLIPALRSFRANISEQLRGSTRTTANRMGLRLRRAFVIGEVALAAALLICSGLLITSFARLRNVDTGFRHDGIISLEISLPATKYSNDAQVSNFYRELLRRLESTPGIHYAGLVNRLPLSGEDSSGPLTIEGAGKDFEQLGDVGWRASSPHYFRAMGIPLLKGREFDNGDVAGKPNVVIVDELTAQTFWHGEDPLGKRLKLGMADWGEPWLTVVGVVGSVRHAGLDSPPKVQVYWPFEQRPEGLMTLVALTDGDPAGQTNIIRSQISAIDADQPVSRVLTMEGLMSESLAQRRFTMTLLTAFAAMALILATVGVYGMMSYAVSLRTRELGIRMSLGASAADLLALIMGETARLTGIGLLAGLLFYAASAQLLVNFIFGVSRADPVVLLLAILPLVIAALAGGLVPALRAARIPMMSALRCE